MSTIHSYILVATILIALSDIRSDRVNVGSGVLDCVRFRSVFQRKHVFGTGYFHNMLYYRILAVYESTTVPRNSAFRIERITEYEEPLYFIKLISSREYVFGGYMSTSPDTSRLPVFSYHHKVNATRSDDGVWAFEKVYVNRVWQGAWYIKNVYYDYYMIASTEHANPPPMAMNARFKTLKLDRRQQVPLTSEHMFFIEEC